MSWLDRYGLLVLLTAAYTWLLILMASAFAQDMQAYEEAYTPEPYYYDREHDLKSA